MTIWKYGAIVLGCAIGFPASAQDSFPVMDWGPLIQTEAMNSVTDDIGRSDARRAGLPYPGNRKAAAQAKPVRQTLAQSLGRQLSRSPVTARPAAPASSRYASSPAVRTRLADIMSREAGRQDPAKGEEMRRLVLSGEAVDQFRRVAPTLGYSADDAIDGFAFYLLAQWGVANDHRADVTRAQAAGVRHQAANAYALVADQLRSDALRQEFAEMLVIQGAILAGVHEAAVRGGDNAATARYAELARRGGEKVFSVDPARIVLTDAGFRAK